KDPPTPRTRCKAPSAQEGCAFFAPGFFAQAKKGGSRRHGAKALDPDLGLTVAVAIAKQRKIKSSSLRSHPHPALRATPAFAGAGSSPASRRRTRFRENPGPITPAS